MVIKLVSQTIRVTEIMAFLNDNGFLAPEILVNVRKPIDRKIIARELYNIKDNNGQGFIRSIIFSSDSIEIKPLDFILINTMQTTDKECSKSECKSIW